MSVKILIGDSLDMLKTLPDESVHCCVTSPPYYGLRDYGVSGQIGLEASPREFVEKLVDVFREVRRVLRRDGTCWVNMGDSYAGSWGAQGRPNGEMANRAVSSARQITAHPKLAGRTGSIGADWGMKPKDKMLMPHRLAIALCDDGWWIRDDIVWAKPNPMPESIRDRCTKAHEYLFQLAKSERYYYDFDAMQELCSENTNPRRAGNGYKTPDGWDATKGEGGHGSFHKDGREKGRKLAAAGSGTKNNGSFNEAMSVMPEKRNRRSVWTVATQPFKEAHFATFPPALIEPCILAGTSEKGVCPHCAAPWVRQVAETGIKDHDGATDTKYDDKSTAGRLAKLRQAARERGEEYSAKRTTIGWAPSCECQEHKPVPATVLDPFFGAGTTGLVADRLQRHCIGIELNPAYAEMARHRLNGDAPLFQAVA